MALLVAKGISKRFERPFERTLLKEVSLSVEGGSSVAIMGPSGVGKSTLLHILGTLERPSSGSLFIAGRDALKTPGFLLRSEKIGFVFQNCNLLEGYSVLDNVLMPARIARRRPLESEGRALLAQVGMEESAQRVAGQLSGGEKQRVALARALCNAPDLLLADEPSGNLDEENSKQIHTLLTQAARDLGKGVVVVTHNQQLASQCDLIYTLREGVLEAL